MSEPAPLLRPGFADPTLHAQQTFRALLDAMARPGTIAELECPLEPPRPLDPATAAVALTLFDADTRVRLDPGARSGEVEAFLRFHCGCPLTDEPGRADFAVCLGWPARFADFAQGEPDYPDRSATLVVQLDSLREGRGFRLRGPGVKDMAHLAFAPCPADFAARWAGNRAGFPLGVDLILAAGRSFCALPRSLTIEEC
jgi:alpha-D-ribose 1-methylphosphonate 5-triphosphate synthase subunit PhnH